MAKMFYSAEEAAQKLGKTPDELSELARNGQLREFRDGGNVQYRVEDIDGMASPGIDESAESGEILLEPAEQDDSSIVLAASSGSDVLSLDDIDSAEATASGKAADDTGAKTEEEKQKEKKEGTVVSSVGMSVFDDDELDEVVDPLAQTAVTDVGGLGLEGVGSGSGILDLTRESDDTSLGAELMDEIYADDEQKSELGDDTRAGLEAGVMETEAGEDIFEPIEAEEDLAGAAAETVAPAMAARRPVAVAAGADPLAGALTGAMIVAFAVMAIAGVAAAGLSKGTLPGLVESAYDNMTIFLGSAVGALVIAAGLGFFLGRR